MGGFEGRGERRVLEVLLGMLVEMMHAFCVTFVLGVCFIVACALRVFFVSGLSMC